MSVATTALAQRGYMVFPRVLTPEVLDRLRQRFSAPMLDQVPSRLSTKSGVMDYVMLEDPVIAAILCWPRTLEILSGLGYLDPKLHSFYLSAKPPASAPMGWHRDITYEWNSPLPPELFAIYYLDNTTHENGCLRVIPGSHITRDNTKTMTRSNIAAVGARAGEIDVPISAGDMFLGDRRLLHATQANGSTKWRRAITVAYAVNWRQLPPLLQAKIRSNKIWHDTSLAQVSVAIALQPKLASLLPKSIFK